MSHLISIIIPVYNVEEYLEKCIKSVLSQTYKNIEILLVNDGSKDKSLDICQKYKKIDERIILIDKKNGGLSSARNIGIEVAKGEFLSFIDSDDWVEPDFIETLYNLININNADISQCSFIIEYEKKLSEVIRKQDIVILSGLEAIKNLYNKRTYVNTVIACNKLYKREIFNKLRYPEGMFHEDEAIIHEILYFTKRVVVSETTLYHYFFRKNSITKGQYSIRRLDSIKAFEQRLEFLKQQNEVGLVELTLPMYFRVLLGNISELYYSKIDNKELYLSEISNKIDIYLSDFKGNPNMSIMNKMLLKSYIIHPKLGYSAVKSLVLVKRLLG